MALPGAPSAPAAPPAPLAAQRYWRAVCALALSHLLGASWPPPGERQRRRVVGHWGCNPGIAWATGHLAATWPGAEPFRLVVGTGHASSFLFAHGALRDRADAATVSAGTARYGMPGGDPSELLTLPGLPYSGGELGPALGVSQGLAAHTPDGGAVVCVIGDGECETPAALAALAHADVLLPPGRGGWLPVVNANGARMGGPSRFGEGALTGLLRGFGYEVLRSGTDPAEASAAAGAALRACLAGRRVAWLSVTDKGWPAPEVLGGAPYRGHRAHKVPSWVREAERGDEALAGWFAAVDPGDLLGPDGAFAPDVVALARRAELRAPDLPAGERAVPAAFPVPGGEPAADGSGSGAGAAWRAPVSGADETLARLGVVVHSPDEASSNGLRACLDAGLVTEVLAEEVCAAWTWGAVEAGRPAAFVTYEAFAPLAGSLVAQYGKLTAARPDRGTPPLLVVATSLGWANAPTHQNTDLTGTLLARPGTPVVYPVGAASAAGRLAALATGHHDGAALLLCSKQRLPDLPDPGGDALLYRLAGAAEPAAYLVAVGDVCVTEAVAAAALAAGEGVPVGVVAVVAAHRAAGALAALRGACAGRPVLGAACCAARYVEPALWAGLDRIFPVHGYAERWAPTAWETLRANGLDRLSLLAGLGIAPAGAADALERRFRTGRDLAGVLPFDCPPLVAVPVPAGEGVVE